MKTKLVRPIVMILGLALLLSACGEVKPAGLTDDQVMQVTAGLLTAIDQNEYAAFQADLSDEMAALFTEEQFNQLHDLLQTNSGSYVSMDAPELSNSSGYAVYRIRCQYELEDVMVTVTFLIDGTQVEGLFFDSPNLRTAAQ
jgi:hypothetical protein